MKKLSPLLFTFIFILACNGTVEPETQVIDAAVESDLQVIEEFSNTSDSRSPLLSPDNFPAAIGPATGKPVIYLYPESITEVNVELDYKGRVSAEYPASDEGLWNVIASPDGTLFANDRSYPYLFWEGYSELTKTFEINEGFVISNKNVVSFLEEKLTELGLNEKEQADFITYWMPQMIEHEWVKLRFLFEEYDKMAHLTVTPTPDSFIRVFMIFEGLDSSIDIPEQELPETPKRFGFTAIEWGGSELDR